MLDDISIYRELVPGFHQVSFISGRTRVLLHRVEQGVPLKKHRHKQAQFGYNFSGHYEFPVDDMLFHVQPRSKYLLSGLIYHSAISTTEYYSIDVKFMPDRPFSHKAIFDHPGDKPSHIRLHGDSDAEAFHFDLENHESIDLSIIRAGGTGTARISLSPRNTNLLIASRDGELSLNEQNTLLQAMHIYRLKPMDLLNLDFIASDTEIVVISIQPGDTRL